MRCRPSTGMATCWRALPPAPLRPSVPGCWPICALLAALAQDGGRYLTPYALVRASRRAAWPRRAPTRGGAPAHRARRRGLEALRSCCSTPTPNQKAETMAVLVDWPGEQALPRRFISGARIQPATQRRPPWRTRRPSASVSFEHLVRRHHTRQAVPGAVLRAIENANPGSWWERLAPLMQQDVQPQDAVAAANA